MKVHIQSKWYASASDAELLDEKKRTRWLQNIDTQQFVHDVYGTDDAPRIPCTKPIDITLDLPVGKYVFEYVLFLSQSFYVSYLILDVHLIQRIYERGTSYFRPFCD